MTDTATMDDVVEIHNDGLTVQKKFAADEFPVPAIRFEISSTHDGPVTVRLSESIPESFPMDSVGFHPKYHSDDWTAFEDNRVEFVGTIDPDDPLITVYGIRIDDQSEVAAFLSEPAISVISTEDSDSSTPTSADDSAVEAVIPE